MYLSSFIPRLLFWKTNKREMNLTPGTQNSIKTNALQGFSTYFKPTNRDKIGRSKNYLNKDWLTIEYLLRAGHGTERWKYMTSSNAHDISNRKLPWSLSLITHMPSLTPRKWKSLGSTALSASRAGTLQRHRANPLPMKGRLKLTSTLYQSAQEKRENISLIPMILEMHSLNYTSPKYPCDCEKRFTHLNSQII